MNMDKSINRDKVIDDLLLLVAQKNKVIKKLSKRIAELEEISSS
jgi:hypothetical protein